MHALIAAKSEISSFLSAIFGIFRTILRHYVIFVQFFFLQARSLSTSSAAAQLVKTPVPVFGIEGRYASALYSAASKTKQLDGVEKDLTNLQTALRADSKLRDLFLNPAIKRNLKSSAIKDVAKQVNYQESTSNLLQALAENGRLKKIDGIINTFKLVMAAHRGDVVCEVVSAKPLDQGQKSQLEAALKKLVKANENIKLTARVDPNIIGGIVVVVGDKYVDLSIASKVKKYRELISGSV